MKYRSKLYKVNIKTLATLALRIIDTVIKSGIEAAKVSKRFLQLLDLSVRYQSAIALSDGDQLKEAIKKLYNLRSYVFFEMHAYLEGLLNSPDAEMKAAANLLFRQVNRFGKNFSKLRLADQSIQYVSILAALKEPEYVAALAKTMLTENVSTINQVQLDYEQLYMGYGNKSLIRVAPSNLRNELIVAIKLYMEEVNLMATREDTSEWYSLCANLQIRFDEVSITVARKSKNQTDSEIPSSDTAA